MASVALATLAPVMSIGGLSAPSGTSAAGGAVAGVHVMKSTEFTDTTSRDTAPISGNSTAGPAGSTKCGGSSPTGMLEIMIGSAGARVKIPGSVDPVAGAAAAEGAQDAGVEQPVTPGARVDVSGPGREHGCTGGRFGVIVAQTRPERRVGPLRFKLGVVGAELGVDLGAAGLHPGERRLLGLGEVPAGFGGLVGHPGSGLDQ